MELSLNPTEWYMKLLAPLSPDIKLDLISKLSESLKEKVSHSEKTILKSEDLLDLKLAKVLKREKKTLLKK